MNPGVFRRVAANRWDGESSPVGGPAPGGVKRDLTCRMMGEFWTRPPARRSLMAHSTTPRLHSQVHRLRTQPASAPELGLEAVRPQATVAQVLQEEGGTWRSILSTPWVTFWVFFWQVLSPDRSCRAALKRLAAWMGLHGRQFGDEDTSP